MKQNVFQKILIVLYLVIFAIISIFNVPFRSDDGIVYAPIWTPLTYIDFYRLGIFMLAITIPFAIAYKSIERANDLEDARYKKMARVEVKIFLLFISITCLPLMGLIAINVGNKLRYDSINKELTLKQATFDEIYARYSKKKNLRAEFYRLSLDEFDLSRFNGNIQEFWNFLTNAKEDKEWLTYYYGFFEPNTISRRGVDSPEAMKQYIETNEWTGQDVKQEENVKAQRIEITKVKNKLSSIKFYKTEEIRTIVLTVLAGLFIILYVVRPLYIFIKGIFFDIKVL